MAGPSLGTAARPRGACVGLYDLQESSGLLPPGHQGGVPPVPPSDGHPAKLACRPLNAVLGIGGPRTPRSTRGQLQIDPKGGFWRIQPVDTISIGSRQIGQQGDMAKPVRIRTLCPHRLITIESVGPGLHESRCGETAGAHGPCKPGKPFSGITAAQGLEQPLARFPPPQEDLFGPHGTASPQSDGVEPPSHSGSGLQGRAVPSQDGQCHLVDVSQVGDGVPNGPALCRCRKPPRPLIEGLKETIQRLLLLSQIDQDLFHGVFLFRSGLR